MQWHYSLWVNWVEAEEQSYNIPEFFEWDEEDHLELIESIPLYKVTPGFFEYVQNGLNPLPEELLCELEGEEFILCDGERTLVVGTLGYDFPILKSRMHIVRENLILHDVKKEKVMEFDYVETPAEYHVFSPHPSIMVGLTREERENKKCLLLGIDGLEKAKKDQLLYYYTELQPTKYKEAKRMKKSDLYQALIHTVNNGWTENHEKLLEILIEEQTPLQFT